MTLIWFIRLDKTETYKITDKEDLSYSEAVERFGEVEASSYNLQDQQELVYVKHRTLIPLIFKRDTIVKGNLETVRLK